MDKQSFSNLVNDSDIVSNEATLQLENITKKYPYFQSAKAVYLKGLQQNNNYKYNKALKSTAAITIDRSVLFDYISNFDFTSLSPKEITKENDTVELKLNTSENSIESAIIEENNLALGKPLEFTKNEAHSFNEWLQLSVATPIARDPQKSTETTLFKNKDLIDHFIEKNPSIQPLNKESKPVSVIPNTYQESELMTETLAKVYLEQKKYSNAIKAFQILILKYPEKSGFFADQIKKIEHLKNK